MHVNNRERESKKNNQHKQNKYWINWLRKEQIKHLNRHVVRSTQQFEIELQFGFSLSWLQIPPHIPAHNTIQYSTIRVYGVYTIDVTTDKFTSPHQCWFSKYKFCTIHFVCVHANVVVIIRLTTEHWERIVKPRIETHNIKVMEIDGIINSPNRLRTSTATCCNEVTLNNFFWNCHIDITNGECCSYTEICMYVDAKVNGMNH